MMQQYLQIHDEYPDCLLLFRLGDFYELFFEDAKTASRELELTLTGKDCGLEERAPMCGVPFHSVNTYIEKLIARGYKVAIVTSRLWYSTRTGLYKFDIADLFDAVVSAEDTTIHKPDPTPCLLCLEKLGIAPDEALMVGDSKFDILCARNAGVDSCLVSWSISVGDELREQLAPEYYITDAMQLLDIVENA